MVASIESPTIFTIQAKVRKESKLAFIDWQAKLNAAIAGFPGFISLEILSPNSPQELTWVIVERFQDPQSIAAWRKSAEFAALEKELKGFLIDLSPGSLKEESSNLENVRGGITEVFVTQVSPDKESAYREWLAKIHQTEATFPGFRGMYVQSPSEAQGRNWITLLQFDTQKNLDRWLSSPERAKILKEGESLIASLERHRVISPYAGWFESIAKKGVIPVWKQTMLILLVLFPIVMLEMKFLNPLTAALNPSLGTFIGNAISVSLVSWPMLPFAIRNLTWWLIPDEKKQPHANLMGTLFVLGLYLIEIVALWNLI